MIRRAVLLAAALCAAGIAHAADGLSGTYQPAGDAGAAFPADAQLVVRAEGRGWLAMFRGEGLALLPLSAMEQHGLFPDIGPEARLQCAYSRAFLFCRVSPGTAFPDKNFTSTTGYFTALSDNGIFEMRRVD
ncbi:hypothetical protein V3391_12210 [Luteimonas sp. SMYT11W]|uniref:Uncharacterized protein n=1 Tax=Luteimonas flava TaxID=3115822 RepID=A0ABU7WG82_9GAMM